MLYHHQRLYIPSNCDLRTDIIRLAHESITAGHPGVHRTAHALTRHYYWPTLQKEVKAFIAACDICQRVKAPRIQPAGLLQPLPIPVRPWQQIGMDFVTGLPTTSSGHNAILVFVDKLTRMVLIAPTQETCTAEDTAELFMQTVYRHHGLPRSIVSDRDPRFTSKFWVAMHQALGTHLCLSTAFHPQTDGATERSNQVIEDILRAHCSNNQQH